MSRFLLTLINFWLTLAISFNAVNVFAAPIQLSMGTSHFARILEFYYQKPKPERIAPALSAMAKDGTLQKSENRLLLAAFLAELAKDKKIEPVWIINTCSRLGVSGRHLAAWAIRLAALPGEDKRLQYLLGDDKILLDQLKRTPAPLDKLSPARENSILGMYWGAFMATGNPFFINSILDAALEWHKSRNQGLNSSPTGQLAAATLYEYAPRHEIIRKILQKRLQNSNEEESQIIKDILDQH